MEKEINQHIKQEDLKDVFPGTYYLASDYARKMDKENLTLEERISYLIHKISTDGTLSIAITSSLKKNRSLKKLSFCSDTVNFSKIELENKKFYGTYFVQIYNAKNTPISDQFELMFTAIAHIILDQEMVLGYMKGKREKLSFSKRILNAMPFWDESAKILMGKKTS